MEYNTDRPQLRIPEYGRNVHNMVRHCMSIDDKDKRNRVARSIIDVIGNLNPHLRDAPDFKHKLWDHLFVMSNFELDVDSPYPIPTPETFTEKPDLISYPQKSIRYRHYGNIVQNMVKYAIAMEDGDMKDAMVHSIAIQMKKSYLLWNKDTVDDAVIVQDLREMSGGALVPKNLDLSSANQWRPQQQNPRYQNNNNNRNKNKKNNRRKFKK